MAEETTKRRSQARSIGRRLFRITLGLLLIVGITLVAIFSFEQYSLQPLAKFVVEKTTSRVLSIDGNLDARPGRIISVHISGIRLANAEWGSSDDMLDIDDAAIYIDLLDLLSGRMIIGDVSMSGVKLLFEEDEQGRSNWAMGSDDNPTKAEPEDRDTLVLPIARSQLSDIDITVIDAGLSQPVDIHLASAGHGIEQGNELRATVVGAIKNRPLKLQARIGPLSQLLAAGAVDFEITGDFEAASLDAKGHLDNLLAPQQAKVEIFFESPEISKIFTTLGYPALANGETSLKGSLQPSGDHHKFALTSSIGALKLDADARLQSLDSIDGAAVTVSVEGPDLDAAARLAGLEGFPAQAFNFTSDLSLSGQQLTIGETSLVSGDNHFGVEGSMSQFPRLEGTNLKLQLSGANYLAFAKYLGITDTSELQPEPFEIRTDFAYDAQNQQTFKGLLQLADISGVFSGKLTEYPEFIGSQVDFRLDGRNDALLQQLLGRPPLIEGTASLEGGLERVDTGFNVESTKLSVGANELRVSGTIGEKPLLDNTDLSIRFQGPDLEKIAVGAGYTGFIPTGNAEIDLKVRALDKNIHIDDLGVGLAGNKLQLSGLLKLPAGVAGSRVKISLAGEDIATVLPPAALPFVEARQSYELNGTLATGNGELLVDALLAKLGETELKTSGRISTTKPLADLSLKVDARGSDLSAIVPGQLLPISLPADEFTLSGGFALSASGLELDGVEAQIGSDRFALTGTIPLDTPTDGLKMAISAEGPDLDRVFPLQVEQANFEELPYELTGNVQLVDAVMSLQQLDFSTPRSRLSGELSASLKNPLEFGKFDLDANGDNLAAVFPAIPDYTPAAVPFDFNLQGSWDSKQVSIEEGKLQLDASKIDIHGEVTLPPNALASRMVVSASGDDLSDFGQYQDIDTPENDFDINAELHGDNNGFQVPQLAVRVGESDLSGSLQIRFTDKPDINIRLKSNLLDLASLISAKDDPLEKEEPAQSQVSDGRLIPQQAVPVEMFHWANLDTRINLKELRLRRNNLFDLEYNSTLQDGELQVSQLRATARAGQISAQFRVLAEGERIAARGRLEGKDFSLGVSDASDGETELPKQDLQLEFATEGATVRELAGNLDAYALLTGGNGRFKNNAALNLYGSFFTELMTTVNPFVTREPYTNISCFAAYAEIIDGLAKIDPGTVIRTDKLDGFIRGAVDLNTEQIHLRFDTTARSGLGISSADFINPFVGVSGTLSEPKLGINSKSATFEGGFALYTGGLSIVAKSLYSRWFGSKEPCVDLEVNAQEYLREKQAEREKRVSQQETTVTDEQ